MADIALPTNPDAADAVWHAAGNEASLTLSGHFNAHTLGNGLWTRTRTAQTSWLGDSGTGKGLTIDLAQVSYLDGAGIAFLIDLQHAQETAGGQLVIHNLDQRYAPLIAQYQPINNLFPVPDSDHHDTKSTLIRVGQATEATVEDARNQIVFIGKLASALGWAARNPRQVRWNDFINVAVEAGVAALPIISLVAFLIGVILAFQSAIGLKQFGAETFVANLVSLSIFRELGPLMTAILFAGRSSAAFAAEIGTMTVNNEVDALVTGGIDPIRFLVLPRLLAGLLVAPILSIFSDLIGIFAASLTMLAYQVPFVTFYEAVLKTIHVNDIMSGLTKSLLFGLIVAGVGCLRGMQTGTGAAAVGLSATRAVVTSLILIVMVDGIFAYISYKTGF
ncbi:MAG: STAS domain-containing protein [Rhodocyclaceae bacterium]|nr:STAS domain-containing protein [Rhodocyclaceae bacterium]